MKGAKLYIGHKLEFLTVMHCRKQLKSNFNEYNANIFLELYFYK